MKCDGAIFTEQANIRLMRHIGFDVIEGRFRVDHEIGNSYGGMSFKGLDLENSTPVFIKVLLCPRGEFERAKFLTERDALNSLMDLPFPKISPAPLYFGCHGTLPAYVIVTEWIEGQSLRNWLDSRGYWTHGEGLEVLHRLSVALAYATLLNQHRDIHPENVVLLPSTLVEREGAGKLFDPAIRILDWGESMPVMLGAHEISSNHLLTIFQFAPRHLGGSFYSLPPEVIWSPWVPENSIGGRYESWALGLLMHEVFLNRSCMQHRSLGDYSEALRSEALASAVENSTEEIRRLELLGGDILPNLLQRLLEFMPGERASPAIAAKVFADIRFNGLTLFGSDAASYLADPFSFEDEPLGTNCQDNDY